MCPNTRQDLTKSDIRELGINRVVVAACSPLLHGLSLRNASREAGLNPYPVQIASFSEPCAWGRPDRRQAAARILSQIRKGKTLLGSVRLRHIASTDCSALALDRLIRALKWARTRPTITSKMVSSRR